MTNQKDFNKLFEDIQIQKKEKNRPFPSDRLITNGDLLEVESRMKIVDIAGSLVDQAFCGRSDMCIYFACLVRYALRLMGHKSDVYIGDGTYTNNETIFTWEHSWVVCGEYIIDGNVDSMVENPVVPYGLSPNPYWGRILEMPLDRSLTSERILTVADELDELDDIYIEWKKELKKFLKKQAMIN
ncbi:hypothetical protein C0638_01285 [Paenibacillus sp. lzh-N1]|uniref:hypothetical protein n=1 Tax=Paenibacillus sp. lzh-N1 TaxID=2069255 RepID=UPI000C7F9FAA|nr:hypothetical protein [Paenibacillus sp. lzh-N1]AUO05299.1 hypothetical protein C0638_01285 [Paenibacillus sp. lzh-N1]